jgi:hypothetical protein
MTGSGTLATWVPEGSLHLFEALPQGPELVLGWMQKKSLDVLHLISAFGHYVIENIVEADVILLFVVCSHELNQNHMMD